jgi:hypothetical protein
MTSKRGSPKKKRNLGYAAAAGAGVLVIALLLLALVLHQRYLSAVRLRGDLRRAAERLGLHTLAGALAPALFFLHSQQLGHGYLAGLSLVFIAAMATGMLNLDAPAGQPRWLRQVRISVHAGLATALVVGIGYHVFVSYEFER